MLYVQVSEEKHPAKQAWVIEPGRGIQGGWGIDSRDLEHRPPCDWCVLSMASPHWMLVVELSWRPAMAYL